MKRQTLIFIILIILLSATSILAQARRPFTEDADDGQLNANRTQVMRELGLSRDQLLQIRQINQENRPQKEAAGIKFREAKSELDLAVYADDVDENEVREKLRAVSEAQADMTRINTLHELQVRRILTKVQLKKFREFRRTFAERKEIRQEQMKRLQKRRQQRNAPANDDPPPPRRPI